MNPSSFLVLFLFSTVAYSQTQMEAELLQEKEKLLDNIKTYQDYTKRDLEELKKEESKLQENMEKLSKLEDYEKNFSDYKAFTLNDLQNKFDSLSTFKKIGKTGKFYKCLRESLENKSFLDHSSCTRRHRVNLTSEEQADLNMWIERTGKTLDQVAKEKGELPKLIERNREQIKFKQERYKFSAQREVYLEDSLKLTETKIREVKLLPANQHFVNCNSSTPVINLEEEVPFPGASFKGPFHEVPRDNQDGLGTCYANAAKNLLVGLSGGEDVASFLDVALIYKDSTGSLSSQGLDAGNSCTALNAVREKGYCPQEFAPLETGERNQLGESLFNLGPYNYLATNVNLIRDFLGGLKDFEKSQSPVSQEIMAQASKIVGTLKSNPDLVIPLPVVRHNIPEEWKLKEVHSIKKLESQIPYEKFLNEHREAYRKFYPQYIKSVIEGKGADDIFESYKVHMKDFISKYQLQNHLDEFKRVFKLNTKNDIEDPKLKTKLRDSIQFLKKIMNKEDMSDESFYEFCSGSGSEAIRFLSSMKPLIDQIRSQKLNDEKLFNDDGKFRSALELMQLTVAPACINEENRRQVPAFNCDNGYKTITSIKKSGKPKAEQMKMMRERVVLSLIQGYPVGNSFSTSPYSGHINTIVGMRFNSQTNSCEYLIRESQNGKSDWHSEEGIFNKIDGLTEIRRLK